ncbi:MAG: hypothetical protein KGO51_04110 [Alphaproteobacteria bacterium]|nr:hypothetical protein [Alphaproteobacteria bacterium]
MKRAAVAIAALGLAAAGSAYAASPVSDVDYLRANRCEGIAAGLGADTSHVAAFIKAQGATRMDYILAKGREAYRQARRETSDANLKPRLNTELATSCAAYVGQGAKVARSN